MNAVPLELVDPGTAFSLVGLLYLLMAVAAGVHVVLNKQNEAAAFSWLGIIVLAPLLGAVLYWLFGINRIRRRARAEMPDYDVTETIPEADFVAPLFAVDAHWQPLMRLGMGVHQSPYLAGNHIEPLLNGDEAYPAMIEAIQSARHSVVLSSYIFEYDSVGREFVNALVSAHQRGVAVRVMIDGLGVGYGFSFVRSDRVLRKQGVRTARFLSALSTTGTRFINLRNHRKILSIDGEFAFIGGMNIRDSNLVGDLAVAMSEAVSRASFKEKTQDVHFRVSGPVIDQINAVFAADWQFAAGERLDLPRWSGDDLGAVTSRVLLDGPDHNYKKLQMTLLGAIQTAQHRIMIVSPYFLPGQNVLSALHLAALRGVEVNICVPAKNNLPFVGWAMLANRGTLLELGLHLYESPAPFDHSKLFLVDDHWSMIGSSNWDARSLELNFEINLECYNVAFSRDIASIIENKMQLSTQVTECSKTHILKRLRNNFFRLFSPYL